jgi:hypothetical protein
MSHPSAISAAQSEFHAAKLQFDAAQAKLRAAQSAAATAASDDTKRTNLLIECADLEGIVVGDKACVPLPMPRGVIPGLEIEPYSGNLAYTLSTSEVSYIQDFNTYNGPFDKPFRRGHPSGWWIWAPKIHFDAYTWVEEFQAWHHDYGYVWGNCQKTVYAASMAGYEHFFTNHTPEEWNMGDI